MAVVVLGGGVGGLAAAHWAQARGWHATVLEAAAAAGGWAQSFARAPPPARPTERGPRTLRAAGATHTLRLVAELGLAPRVVRPREEAAATRWLLPPGARRPRRLDASPAGLWNAAAVFGAAHAVVRDLTAPPPPPDALDMDESLRAFALRRLGPRVADGLLEAMARGIYAGDPARLSLRACAPGLADAEARHGGLLRAALARALARRPPDTDDDESSDPLPPEAVALRCDLAAAPFFSFDAGVGLLPRALEAALGSRAVALGARAVRLRLPANPGAPLEVVLADGSVLRAHRVVSALPAYELARILVAPRGGGPDAQAARAMLAALPYSSVATVHLTYRDPDLLRRAGYPGFGFLSCPPTPLLGAVFDSELFADEPATRVTAMFGGPGLAGDRVLARPPDDLCRDAVDALHNTLGLPRACESASVLLAPRAIPQPPPGHLRWRADLLALIHRLANGRLHLAGAAFAMGPGLNAVVARSRAVVRDELGSP